MINYGEVDFITTFLQKTEFKILTLIKIKLKVNDTSKKDEKVTTNYGATDGTDIINKAYLDKNISKT